MSEGPESTWFSSRRLVMRGLKPSDYFLYKQIKTHLNFEMRQLFILGLRMMYACAHGQITREQMLNMANDIYGEDLDNENRTTRPTYKDFSTVITQQE